MGSAPGPRWGTFVPQAPVPPISKSWLRYRLKNFSDSASHLGLNIYWPKTKLQNIGSSPKPPDISLDGNTDESVDSFV